MVLFDDYYNLIQNKDMLYKISLLASLGLQTIQYVNLSTVKTKVTAFRSNPLSTEIINNGQIR